MLKPGELVAHCGTHSEILPRDGYCECTICMAHVFRPDTDSRWYVFKHKYCQDLEESSYVRMRMLLKRNWKRKHSTLNGWKVRGFYNSLQETRHSDTRLIILN